MTDPKEPVNPNPIEQAVQDGGQSELTINTGTSSTSSTGGPTIAHP